MFGFLRRKTKKEKAEEKARRWAESQKREGVPLQKLWHEALNRQENSSHEEMWAYNGVAREIEDILVDRNVNGKALEKEGKIDEAIALYEANLLDKFDASHPYERLRIIYAKRKDYDNAIRVCETVLGLRRHPRSSDEDYQKWVEKYQGWIEKYNKV